MTDDPPAGADLGVELTGPTAVEEGDEARWTATVTNAGPGSSGAVEAVVELPDDVASPVVEGEG